MHCTVNDYRIIYVRNGVALFGSNIWPDTEGGYGGLHMRNGRKSITQTNMKATAIICIVFALLMSAITEDLKILIVTVLTIPIVVLLLFILWLKFGYNGIQLNSINVFVMLTLLSVYSSIPLFSVIWGTWLSWLTILIHLMTYVIG